MAKPISLAQEVRASPTNPADINTSLRRPQAPRAAPMAPPRTVNRGTFQRAPVAAILQGGGMNGFGAAPIPLGQPARASLMVPNMVNQSLRRPQAARGAPMAPPREVNRGTFQRVPVQAILQGGGMNGAPLQVSNINGAPLIVAPIQSGGGLGAMNSDMSVSAQQRAAKAIKAGGPIVGDYTDAIRSSAGFAFGPKRMPGQGFAAASYSYPAQQMVIGATLAGVPILAPPQRAPMPNMASPMFATRGGGTIRGQISSSPSEDRRKLMSTLMGLGYYATEPAVGGYPRKGCVPSIPSMLASGDAWTAAINQYADCAYPTANGPEQFRGEVPSDPEKARIVAIWNERTKRLGTRVYQPWTQTGRFALGLPSPDFDSLAADVTKGAADVQAEIERRKAAQGGGSTQPPGTTGIIQQPPLRVFLPGGGSSTPPPPKKKDNTMLIVGGVAALAALGAVAYVATKK